MFRFRLQLAELMLLVTLAAILIHFSLHVLDREQNYEELNAIELSPDGKLVARASNHGIAVYQVESRKLVMSSDEWSSQLAFSPDSKYLAAGIGSISLARLQVWDCATWQPVASNKSRARSYHALGWSRDGAMLYDTGFDHLLEAWSFNGESLQPAWSLNSGDWVLSLSPSPDGEVLAVGFRLEPTSTRAATLELFDAQTGSPLPTLYDTGPASTDVVTFTSGGRQLVTCQPQDDAVIFWDSASGAKLQSQVIPDCSSLVASPSGNYLAILLQERFALWDMVNDRELTRFTLPRGYSDNAAFRFSTDESRLLVATVDGTVQAWDTATAQQLSVVRGLTLEPGFVPKVTLLLFACWLGVWCGWAYRSGRRAAPEHAKMEMRAPLLLVFSAVYFVASGMFFLWLQELSARFLISIELIMWIAILPFVLSLGVLLSRYFPDGLSLAPIQTRNGNHSSNAPPPTRLSAW